MRPLLLAVKGFTAFRDEQEIDFTGLDVFSIAGATGSGKSSLLDAMTYALYGRVERVGDRVSQLISQGQPRMSVKLEFGVGTERYRVTRSTPARGATKILVERFARGGWRQAGDGADRVREAETMIARAVGLPYDAFTRSVLLPQGRFAEFLVGDPKKRREILTELLGLSLFRRMAERAGAIARESGDRGKWTRDMLDREFADATTKAMAAARKEATAARTREAALAAAAELVADVLGRWEEARRSVEELRACVVEIESAASQARAAAGELAKLAETRRAAAATVKERAAAAKAASAAVEIARKAMAEAEATFGSRDDLSRRRLWAERLGDAERARSGKEAELAATIKVAGQLAVAASSAEAALAERRTVQHECESATTAADVGLEEARHADLVGAVSAGVRRGDPCPVCGVPLQRAPKRAAAGLLERAQRRTDAARAKAEAARRDVADAERALDGAIREIQGNRAERDRLAQEVEGLDGRVAEARAALEPAFGTPLPANVDAAIEARSAELDRLDSEERDASHAEAEATRSLVRGERELDRVLALVERQRDRLGADVQPLVERAARALGEAAPFPLNVPIDGVDEAALLEQAGGRADALEGLSGRLAIELADRSSIHDRLLQEAQEGVAGLVEPAFTLEALAGSVAGSCREATALAATAEQRVKDLAERLERKKQLASEAHELEGRARLFRTLAQALRADHLIAFLQAEALQILAAAGSAHLAGLSDGRYRVVCREDEFFVVDTWNGDEERSVRTLSGGETFLASLALALALSEQARSLSVTDRPNSSPGSR